MNTLNGVGENGNKKPENKRKTIRNNRELVDILPDDPMKIYQELKKTDGFDTISGDSDGYFKSFYDMRKEEDEMVRKLVGDINSIYEVGCGSGATLFLYRNKYPDIQAAGIDYSQKLSSIAKKVLGKDVKITCDEAINLDTTESADLVYSDSVFVYFNDIEYAKSVLEKMNLKAKKAILITEVYDKSKEEECINYRRNSIENYDEKYQGLNKLFFDKKFFEDFAKQYNLKIRFFDVNNKHYWNSKYMFNVLFTK